jgi:hypothetical protein
MAEQWRVAHKSASSITGLMADAFIKTLLWFAIQLQPNQTNICIHMMRFNNIELDQQWKL